MERTAVKLSVILLIYVIAIEILVKVRFLNLFDFACNL